MFFAALFCVFGTAADDDAAHDDEFRRFLMKRQLDTVLSSASGQDLLEAYLDREAHRTNADFYFHEVRECRRHRHRRHPREDPYARNLQVLLWMRAMEALF